VASLQKTEKEIKKKVRDYINKKSKADGKWKIKRIHTD